jgi:hypothetical protein
MFETYSKKGELKEIFFVALLIFMVVVIGRTALSSAKNVEKIQISDLPDSQKLAKEIQKFAPSPISDWSSMCVKRVHFSKDKIPEIAIVSFESVKGEPDLSFYVLKYVDSEWKNVFAKRYEYMYFEGIKIGKAMGNGTQQVILYCHEGSGDYLYYTVIGQVNGKVKNLISDIDDDAYDDESWPNGHIFFIDSGILITAGSQGKLLTWDGKKFVKKPYLLRANFGKMKKGDIVICYKFFDNGEFSAIPVPSEGTFGNGGNLWVPNAIYFESDTVLKIKVGSKIYLDRQNMNDMVEYLYWDEDYFKFDFLCRCLTAIKAGKAEIEITNRYITIGSISYDIIIEK